DDLLRILALLQIDWQDRWLELVNVASGFRSQSRPDMQRYLSRLDPARPPKYSRAVLETLAIIAWRQPVTRGDIEDIRGVTVSTQIVRTLEERGWIAVVGHRDAPGRPALVGTTHQFVDDVSVKSLDDLPPLKEVDATQALASLAFEPDTEQAADDVHPAEDGQIGKRPSELGQASQLQTHIYQESRAEGVQDSATPPRTENPTEYQK